MSSIVNQERYLINSPEYEKFFKQEYVYYSWVENHPLWKYNTIKNLDVYTKHRVYNILDMYRRSLDKTPEIYNQVISFVMQKIPEDVQ